MARRQKNFAKEDGCNSNSKLSTGQNEGKRRWSYYSGNVSKAFDTVPHAMTRERLTVKAVPEQIDNYIKKMYQKCWTIIQCRNKQTVTVELLQGVKQRDSLSPLLFNLTIDSMIGQIDGSTEGIYIEDENVSTLGFADDLVLLDKNKKWLDKLKRWLHIWRAHIASDKCSTF